MTDDDHDDESIYEALPLDAEEAERAELDPRELAAGVPRRGSPVFHHAERPAPWRDDLPPRR